jgi:predicted ATPase/DNA-binding SARP family transcriptional activator
MAVLTTGRLPVRLTPLVGRDGELGAVTRALAGCRMLTLTGPGGAGKTRLALAAAAEFGATDRDVAWVELAALTDPPLIAPALASRLGVQDTPGVEPSAAIAAHLAAYRPGGLLVVLDNCEHLAAEIASLAEFLLAECPALTVLATSREPLGVEGERSWPVPPLERADAARLFEDRARLVAPSFAITDASRDAVAEVCERLDGLPLAIELAAARMRVLSVGQLARRLDDVFGVLTGGARSAPPRHQALRATLDWSYELLNGQERTVFRRLAVFVGGFTLPAAEQVTAFRGIAPGQVFDLLSRLADKSLLQVDSERYHLLATIREYAADKLAQADERDQARQAHLAYYTRFAQEAGDGIEHAAADGLEEELDRVDQERANLRAATQYARDSGDAVAALRIVGQLGRYAYLRGRYREVREWMDQAVADGNAAPPELRARALYGSGRLAYLQCDYEPAVRRLDAALLLYRELGDDAGTAACLQALGSVAREQGRYVRSGQLHADGLRLARAAGDQWAEASAHSYLGFVCWLQGNLELAASECSRALAMFRALGDVEGIAWSLISLGVTARYAGDLTAAAEQLTESRELSGSIGFREGIAWCDEQLGLVALAKGDEAEAETRLRLSYHTHDELRDRWRMASVLESLAAVAVASGSLPGNAPSAPPAPSTSAASAVPAAPAAPAAQIARAEWAARLLGLAHATREAIGTVIPPVERLQHEKTVAVARAALGDAAYQAAWRRGSTAAGQPGAPLPESPPPAVAARTPSDAQPVVLGMAGGEPGSASPGLVTFPLTGATPVLVSAVSVPLASPLTGAAPVLAAPPAEPLTSDGARAAGRAARRESPPAGPGDRAAGPLRVRALGRATVELGGVALTTADWGYAKPRELLFLLITSPPLTREQLGAALWPDLARQQLGNALHTALRELRRALGDNDWVRYAAGQYSVNRDRHCDCDVDVFESALAAAGRARPASAALPDLQRAIAAYGGDFLAGMSAGEWASARRDELRRRFESALLAAGRLHVAAGRHQAAVAVFRRAIEHEPLNESAHRELMTCWSLLGETARAVRHYTELATLLREQVGVPPAAETTALYERLSRSA